MDKEFKKAVAKILEMTEGVSIEDRIYLLEHIISVMKEVSKFKEVVAGFGLAMTLKAEDAHD